VGDIRGGEDIATVHLHGGMGPAVIVRLEEGHPGLIDLLPESVCELHGADAEVRRFADGALLEPVEGALSEGVEWGHGCGVPMRIASIARSTTHEARNAHRNRS
jgi:hypothetical protein